MEKYRISYYFGLWTPNPLIKPSKEIEIEVETGLSEKDIISEGLKYIGTYAKTYSATVVRIG